MLLAFKVATTKTFIHYDISVETFYTTLCMLLHWKVTT